jgi:hypothetical protein
MNQSRKCIIVPSIIFILTLLLHAGCTHGSSLKIMHNNNDSTKWHLCLTDKKGWKYYVDVDTIQYNSGEILFWNKIVNPNGSYVIYLDLVYYKMGRFALLSSTSYDKNSKVKTHWNYYMSCCPSSKQKHYFKLGEYPLENYIGDSDFGELFPALYSMTCCVMGIKGISGN